MNFDERGRTRNISTTLCELLIDEWRSLKDNDGSEELLEQKSEDIMALLRSDAPYDRMVALVLVETREFPFVSASVIRSRPRRRGDGVFMGPRRHDVVDAAVRVYASRERTAVSPRHNVHATQARHFVSVRDEVRPGARALHRSEGALVDAAAEASKPEVSGRGETRGTSDTARSAERHSGAGVS